MRRRRLLTVGGSIVLGTLAGCSGDNGEESASTSTAESGDTDTPDQTTAQSADGESTFEVKAQSTEIDWGERFEVTITAQGGEEAMTKGSTVVYQTEEDSTWAGSYGETEYLWQLGAGETETETFEIKPTETGEHTLALMTSDEQIITEWQLTVNPPTAVFGETISFYDGLDLTLDAEVHEWMDFEITWDWGEKSAVHPIKPKNGMWVKLNIVAENTNTEGKVRLPREDQFSGLAGNSGLDSSEPRSLGEDVGSGTNYIIDDETRNDASNRLTMYSDDVVRQDGYWYPPDELFAGAKEEGWIVFAVEEEDLTVDDVEARVDRQGKEVRATWTSG